MRRPNCALNSWKRLLKQTLQLNCACAIDLKRLTYPTRPHPRRRPVGLKNQKSLTVDSNLPPTTINFRWMAATITVIKLYKACYQCHSSDLPIRLVHEHFAGPKLVR